MRSSIPLLLFALGCLLQALFLIRPHRRGQLSALVGTSLVLFFALRDRDYVLLTGQVLVLLLLWMWSKKPRILPHHERPPLPPDD